MRLLRLACLSCAMVAGVWGRGVGVAVLTFDVCYTNDLYFELATRSDAVLMIFASTQPTEVTLRHAIDLCGTTVQKLVAISYQAPHGPRIPNFLKS